MCLVISPVRSWEMQFMMPGRAADQVRTDHRHLILVPHPPPGVSTARRDRPRPGKDGHRCHLPGLNESLAGPAPGRPAREGWPQIARLHIRHRGTFSYIDATLTDATALKLCRLRYVGSAHQWQFAIYRASHDDYDESVFPVGLPIGTCQDALDTACSLYLNDSTAWA
jgi:hypothetical protein